jgi:hypothetical protein
MPVEPGEEGGFVALGFHRGSLAHIGVSVTVSMHG